MTAARNRIILAVQISASSETEQALVFGLVTTTDNKTLLMNAIRTVLSKTGTIIPDSPNLDLFEIKGLSIETDHMTQEPLRPHLDNLRNIIKTSAPEQIIPNLLGVCEQKNDAGETINKILMTSMWLTRELPQLNVRFIADELEMDYLGAQ